MAGGRILIWHAEGVTNGVAHMGLAAGGSVVWPTGQQTPMLLWARQSHQLLHHDERAFLGWIDISWGDRLSHPSSPHLDLFYGGNGTTPVDSGLPMIGIFYGVRTDSNLEWNRYNGSGQVASDPQSISCGSRTAQSDRSRLERRGKSCSAAAMSGSSTRRLPAAGTATRATASRTSPPARAAGTPTLAIGSAGAGISRICCFFPAEGTITLSNSSPSPTMAISLGMGIKATGSSIRPVALAGFPTRATASAAAGRVSSTCTAQAGVVFVVAKDGRLLWYSYTGGDSDRRHQCHVPIRATRCNGRRRYSRSSSAASPTRQARPCADGGQWWQ